MHETHIRTDIQRALSQFTDGSLAENATELLKVLGYETSLDPEESAYYKVILQNLFFATLNQEMNYPPDKGRGMPTGIHTVDYRGVRRKFRGEGRQHYNITALYRIVVPLMQSFLMPLTSHKGSGMRCMKQLLGLWNLGCGRRGV